MSRLRIVLASASLAAIVVVVSVALWAGPTGVRLWLSVFATLAVAMALPAVVSDPRELTPALLLALAPVAALLSDASPTWLIAPLAGLLLVAAELNALSWSCEGPDRGDRRVSRRLSHIGQLAVLGVAAAWLIGGVAQRAWLGGTTAVLVAGVALVGVGQAVFRDVR